MKGDPNRIVPIHAIAEEVVGDRARARAAVRHAQQAGWTRHHLESGIVQGSITNLGIDIALGVAAPTDRETSSPDRAVDGRSQPAITNVTVNLAGHQAVPPKGARNLLDRATEWVLSIKGFITAVTALVVAAIALWTTFGSQWKLVLSQREELPKQTNIAETFEETWVPIASCEMAAGFGPKPERPTDLPQGARVAIPASLHGRVTLYVRDKETIEYGLIAPNDFDCKAYDGSDSTSIMAFPKDEENESPAYPAPHFVARHTFDDGASGARAVAAYRKQFFASVRNTAERACNTYDFKTKITDGISIQYFCDRLLSFEMPGYVAGFETRSPTELPVSGTVSISRKGPFEGVTVTRVRLEGPNRASIAPLVRYYLSQSTLCPSSSFRPCFDRPSKD